MGCPAKIWVAIAPNLEPPLRVHSTRSDISKNCKKYGLDVIASFVIVSLLFAYIAVVLAALVWLG